MPTSVINIKDAPNGWRSDPDYVYIGRAVPRHGLKSSEFANPFSIGRDAETREQVIDMYRARLIKAPAEMIEKVRDLRGKTLVCWCKPEACHGDVLAAIADGNET